MLWGSRIWVGEALFEEILRFPVPLELQTLRAMGRSPLGLDLYMWLTYRLFTLNRSVKLPWWLLYRQFGVHPNRADKVTVDNFRKKVLRELGKLKAAWPELRYDTPRGCLELHPASTRIPPTGTE